MVPAVVRAIFERRIIKDGDCWIWPGATSKSGYGGIHHREYGNFYVHRIAYEIANGAIPDGYQVDHICHNQDLDCQGGPCPHQACCNPAHLEAVPQIVNTLRGKSLNAMNKRKTHCLRGHAFDEANTRLVVMPNGNTGRKCRKCHAEKELARYRARHLNAA